MICCALGCGHKSGNGCHFYNFPSPNDGPDWEKWYKIWVMRINRINKDGELWLPETPNTKLCSCHFRPEQQWDPKSRKGGLKCKEPVFFAYNKDLLVSPGACENAQTSPSASSCTEGTSGDKTYKRVHREPSPSNTPVEKSAEPASKMRSLPPSRRTLQRGKALLRSSATVPKLKVREYLQHQDEVTYQTPASVVNNWNTSSTGREEQYLIPTLRMPSLESSRQGSEPIMSDNQADVLGTQVMYPEDGHIEFIEVACSESTSDVSDTSYSPVPHQMSIKHESRNASNQVVHVLAVSSERNLSPPLPSVKIETECDPMPSNSSVVDTNQDVLPRILSTYSLESDVVDADVHMDDQGGSFHQFVDHRDETLRELSAVVPPKNQVQKAKISNVKPIRIFTSKSMSSGSKAHQETLSVGPLEREEIRNAKQIGAENVYDQIFNHLATPKSPCHLDDAQAAVSQDSTVSIADMLGDHLTSPDLHSHLSLHQALERVKELEKDLSIERFGLQRFMGSDEKIKFYTGFRSVDTLMRFFWRIEPDDLTSDRSRKWKDAMTFAKETLHDYQDLKETTIPYMDELFLFLCYVWLGLQPEDLADRFALPTSKHALFVIFRWVYYLHVTLPSTALRMQSTTNSSKSVRFQGQFCNTRVLLHSVKIRAQQQSLLNHLSCANLSSLLGFSPSGEVVFTADLMPEVSSDRDLMQRSGILPLLQRGNGIIVEGEFMKNDLHLFSSMGVKVHPFPSFDLPHNAATFKRGSCPQDTHRCHTEVVRLLCAKFVRTFTGFKCLRDVVLDPVSHVIKDLWKVCSLLVNYQQGYRSL